MRVSRVAWLQALIILTLLLPMVGGVLYVYGIHQRAQSRLADSEPRFARLAGFLERQGDMKALVIQGKEQLARHAYPTTQDITQAGNDAQQRIRSLFADSKLEIISIQVLPPKEEGKFDRIFIDLRVEGDLSGLQNALSLLSTQTPSVLMGSMTLQTIGAVRPASTQRLGGQFNFSVLRVRP